MEATTKYDAIIIGVGQAGNPLTTALVEAGWRVAVIERRYVGGTCINDGCTPTKTLIASGRMAYLARRSVEYGIHTGPVEVAWEEIHARKQRIVASFRENIRRRISGFENATLLDGEARFIESHTVEVALHDGETRRLEAGHIFINTGGRPIVPSIPGLADVPRYDSTTIMDVEAVPERLLILGGGYIGVEFGQLFGRLGSEVTILQRASHLVPREDDDIAEALEEILREDGLELLLEAQTTRVTVTEKGEIEVNVQLPSGERILTGTDLLVATGRRPNVEALNLPSAGVETDKRGYISVNERLETSVHGVYALGDVRGAPPFTHIAYDDYRIVKSHLLGDKSRARSDQMVPYTLFTDPQLGRIGLTEREAREKGYDIRVATIPMSWVARAIEVGETRGMLKAVVNAADERILGAAMLGIEGGELMTTIQIAMMGNLPYSALRDGIFAHPTLAEALNTLFSQIE